MDDLETKTETAPKVSKPKAPKTAKPKKAKKAKAPKKAKTKVTKRAGKKPAKAKATGKSRGNPLSFPDKTLVRMPAGWLKKLNATAKAKGFHQGFALRKLIGGFIGEKVAA